MTKVVQRYFRQIATLGPNHAHHLSNLRSDNFRDRAPILLPISVANVFIPGTKGDPPDREIKQKVIFSHGGRGYEATDSGD